MTYQAQLYRKSDKFDWNLFLFGLNAFFVMVQYASAVFGAMAAIKAFRIGLSAFSILVLIISKNKREYYVPNTKITRINILALLILCVIPFSLDPFFSISRFLIFVPNIIYLNYFAHYMFVKYEKEEALVKILKVFFWVYSFPIIDFLLFGSPLSSFNIYGTQPHFFTSNGCGWASTFVAMIVVDLHFRKVGKFKTVGAFVLMITPATFLGFISGSRSSYLCVAFSIFLLVFFSKKLSVFAKIVSIILIAVLTNIGLNMIDSAISSRLLKSEYELEQGAIRFQLINSGIQAILENPTMLLHGVGFDNFRYAIGDLVDEARSTPVHNSYYQVFIENGIIVFTYFFIMIAGTAVVKYVKNHVRRFVFFPTLMIIPFFESNFGAGQFLFYPWMFFMIYYVQYSNQQIAITEKTTL